MMMFWQTLQIIAPVFILIIIGMLLKKFRMINTPFVEISSKLVFNVALPCLVFIKLSVVNFSQVFKFNQIIYICIATIASFLLIWFFAHFWIRRGEDLGAFIQGGFRSNFSIVGFAIILYLYKEEGLAQAAVFLAFLMPLYNILAIIILTITARQEELYKKHVFYRMFTNPLMISVVIAMLFPLLKLHINPVIFNTTEILSRLALPLALLGIGGSLNLEAVRTASKLAIYASIIKIIIIPILFTGGAILLGFKKMELAIMFILFGSPTAVTSFVMAGAMGANSKLASNIILISTLGATFTITAGIVILKHYGFIL